MTTDPDIRDDRDAHRYRLDIEGQTAVVIYNEVAGGLLITETLVPKNLEGRGIASRMARHVLTEARMRGLRILPTCPFFAGFVQKHPEYADVVDPGYRTILGV
jgi:predicted GNAT family acetyltransferase